MTAHDGIRVRINPGPRVITSAPSEVFRIPGPPAWTESANCDRALVVPGLPAGNTIFNVRNQRLLLAVLPPMRRWKFGTPRKRDSMKSTYARMLKAGDRFWDFGLIRTVDAEPRTFGDKWIIPISNGTALTFPHTGRVNLVPEGTEQDQPEDEPGEWLPIPGASGYQLHRDLQRVRSVSRYIQLKNGRTMFRPGQEVSVHLHAATGYYKVSIRFDYREIRRDEKLHRLICLVVHGPPPFPGALVRHLNDVKTDNRPENLAWGTKSDNAWDSIANGLHAETNKTHCKQGHPLDRRDRNGHRWCSTCDALRAVRKRDRRRARRALRATQTCGGGICTTPETPTEEAS